MTRETLFDFQLTSADEARAQRLHADSIVIDLLFQGPLSPIAIGEPISRRVQELCEPYKDDAMTYSGLSGKLIARMASNGEIPAFREEWYASGITAGNRQLDLSSSEGIIVSMGEVQRQFDALDWLTKARSAKDIRAAKQNGWKAGIVSAQETIGLGKNLSLLDALYDFGLRMLQLTYNTQDYVGSGCAEPSDGGLSKFGIELVGRLNALGILVDTSHCGKRTTLDACRHSTQPVVASHTGAEAIYPHMRCKSDEELRAIAETGGVIGVFAMPWFIHSNPDATTFHHVLDHIDYVVGRVGVDHVGIGTDWPMSDVTWSLIYFKEHIAPRLGFEKGSGPSTETVLGFERYSRFNNFTRGLVARGYSDADIQKIIGGNWLRVFEAVCG